MSNENLSKQQYDYDIYRVLKERDYDEKDIYEALARILEYIRENKAPELYDLIVLRADPEKVRVIVTSKDFASNIANLTAFGPSVLTGNTLSIIGAIMCAVFVGLVLPASVLTGPFGPFILVGALFAVGWALAIPMFNISKKIIAPVVEKRIKRDLPKLRETLRKNLGIDVDSLNTGEMELTDLEETSKPSVRGRVGATTGEKPKPLPGAPPKQRVVGE